MKKTFVLIFCEFITSFLWAQIRFEKGYFIDNNNQKTECLIKNVDWMNNPKQFDYKLTENNQTITKGMEAVNEFGIMNEVKYVKATVNIDNSSQILAELEANGQPKFSLETLFLKVLVEGEANLYLLKKTNFQYFFFKMKDSTTIIPLVYKQFLKQDTKTTPNGVLQYQKTRVVANEQFKLQLSQSLYCPKTENYNVTEMAYKEENLVHYFELYNQCFDKNTATIKKHQDLQKRERLNLKIWIGLNSSKCSLDDATIKVGFDRKITTSFGLELESILPFNKNKWGLSISPNYQYYNAQTVVQSKTFLLKYHSLELPINLRYYMFLKENQKLFLCGAYILDIPFKSPLEYDQKILLEAVPNTSLSLGMGYTYKQFGGEFRFYRVKGLFDINSGVASSFNKVSFIFSYKF